MNVEAVRNHSVFCAESVFYNKYNDAECENIESFLKKHTYDEILTSVCGETKSYSLLKSKYYQALTESTGNSEFVFTYRLSDNYNIYIDDRIFVYFFQDDLKIGNDRIFSWRYLHCINCIGKRNGYSDDEIIDDFLNMNSVDFYIKYSMDTLIGEPYKPEERIHGNAFYLIRDEIGVEIGEHIVIYNKDNKGIYIADTWWYGDEEIISDLSKLSIIEFGRKYKAFWCL